MMKGKISLNLNDINAHELVEHMQQTIFDSKEQISSDKSARIEYEALKDSCLFETRDILIKMQEDSKRESDINRKRFMIQTFISVIALIASVVAAAAAIISLI